MQAILTRANQIKSQIMKTINDFWQNNPGLTPRQLREMNPENYSIDEAEAMAVHAWLCAPIGWKQKVLNRLNFLKESQINHL